MRRFSAIIVSRETFCFCRRQGDSRRSAANYARLGCGARRSRLRGDIMTCPSVLILQCIGRTALMRELADVFAAPDGRADRTGQSCRAAYGIGVRIKSCITNAWQGQGATVCCRQIRACFNTERQTYNSAVFCCVTCRARARHYRGVRNAHILRQFFIFNGSSAAICPLRFRLARLYRQAPRPIRARKLRPPCNPAALSICFCFAVFYRMLSLWRQHTCQPVSVCCLFLLCCCICFAGFALYSLCRPRA